MFAIYFNSPKLRNQPISYPTVFGSKPHLFDTEEEAQTKCDTLNALNKACGKDRRHSFEVRKYKNKK